MKTKTRQKTKNNEITVGITLKNEIRVQRRNEWLCRGVPFPEGVLKDINRLRLQDEQKKDVPMAAEELGRWPDGSVKWALLQFPVSFEKEGTKQYLLDCSKEKEQTNKSQGIVLSKFKDRWQVDNGVLNFLLPLSGKAFLTKLSREHQDSIRQVRAEIKDDAGVVFVSEMTDNPVIEHQTDKMLVISQRGVHLNAEGEKLFSCVFRLTVFADADDIEIEYQFIHDEPFRDVELKEQVVQGVGHPATDTEHPGMRSLRAVRLIVDRLIESATQYATSPFATVGNEGLISRSMPIRVLLAKGSRTGLYDFMMDGQVFEAKQTIGGSHGWLSVGNDKNTLAVSVRKFVQQWPKGLVSDERKIVVDIWPESAENLHIFQGQAKSHQIKLRVFKGSAEQACLADWHFAYQFPIVLSSSQHFIDSGAVGPVFSYQPRKYPGIESKFRLEFEQFLCYDRLLGMMDYGDYESLGELSWGRAGNFMSNLEHDFAQAVWLQFVRTGSFRYMDFFEAAVRHLMDVDTIHFDDQNDNIGGCREHGSLHVSPYCSLSHMWLESFLSYYFYTGYIPALTTAKGVADLIARKVNNGEEGLKGARLRGWPLIALCSIYQATGENRYAEAAKNIMESFIEGPDPLMADGGIRGGWGPVPYQQAVMGSIAATGLAYYHQTFCDKQSRELFIRICDWLASDAVRTPEGLYVANPGNETAMAYAAYSNLREGLGYAWELTGDEKYLQLGLRDIKENMASTIPPTSTLTPLRVKESYEVVRSTGVKMSTPWRENLRFMYFADKAGLLKDF